MERTATWLGGVEIGSSVMNASGARSAERAEIHELSVAHRGAIVFKSCNSAGLEAPDNLKNRGVEHFATLARELAPGGNLLEHILNTLPLEAEATHLPESVTVSIEGLEAGHSILAKDITLPKGATLAIDPEAVVLQVVSAQVEAPAETEDGTEASAEG